MIHQSLVDVLCEQVEQIMQQFAATAKISSGDFTLVEEAARTTILKLRPVMMSAGIELSAASFQEEYACPKCHKRLRGWRMPARTVMTAQGEATYSALRYRCNPCGKDYYPLEEANGLTGSEFTTGAKAAIAEVAAERPFAHTASLLGRERGLFVSAKEVDRTAREVAQWRLEEEQRLTEAAFGTEAAVLRSEERDPLPEMPALHTFQRWKPGEVAQISVDGAMLRSTVRGPSPGDGLEWFECRAGIIAPVEERSRGETAYVGGVCSPDTLFDRLASAWRRGGHDGRPCAFVSDGARWIWDRVSLYFPRALQVLDIYHASEHVASAASALYGDGTEKAALWKREARRWLLEPAGITSVLRMLISGLREPGQALKVEEVKKEIRYLWGHRHRMRYFDYKEKGFPVGSGAMESAIKQLSSQRMRQAGMKWSRSGADALLRLRAAHLSGSLDATVARRHKSLQEAARQTYIQQHAMAA